MGADLLLPDGLLFDVDPRLDGVDPHARDTDPLAAFSPSIVDSQLATANSGRVSSDISNLRSCEKNELARPRNPSFTAFQQAVICENFAERVAVANTYMEKTYAQALEGLNCVSKSLLAEG